jgi:hypothetical protein
MIELNGRPAVTVLVTGACIDFRRSANRGERGLCAGQAGKLGSMCRHTSTTHSIHNPLGVGMIPDVAPARCRSGDTLITAFGRNGIVGDRFRRVLSAEACELTRQVKGGWCRAS